MSTTVATTNNGGVIPGVIVANQIIGTNEINVSFKNNTAAAIENLIIFPAGWNRPSDLEPFVSDSIVFKGKHFEDAADFYAVMQAMHTQVQKMKITASNISNLDEDLIYEERMPTGEKKEVSRSLTPFKTASSVAGGYQDSVTLDGQDAATNLWPGQCIKLSRILPGATITFKVTISGVNRQLTLNPIGTNQLG